MPEVSVIVPAHDAAGTLGGTLEALSRQAGDLDYEVVVVDDGSRDATAALAERAEVTLVRHAVARGAAAARNAGVASSSGALLAFTDADCEPARDWLERGLAALRGADLVQGAVLPEPGADPSLYDRTLRVESESGLYESANLFVRRDWFERLGGFRRFRGDAVERPHGEDTVFGWKLRRAGGRTRFAADARVFHAVFRRGASGFIAEHWRLRYFPALVAEVPELRGLMYLGVFQTRRRAAFDLALAGAAAGLAARRLAPLAAALPYALCCLPAARAPRPSALRETAALLAADALGGLALVCGSVAARELVL